MAVSAQTLINIALTNMGILQQGGVPNASDSAEGLIRLNQMLGQWRIQKRFIWAFIRNGYALVANQSVYPIGPGATAPFNVARPTFIEQAYISFVGPGAHPITSPLKLLTAREFSEISDLSSTAEVPQRMYYDRQSPIANITLDPAPRCTVVTQIVLWTWAEIPDFENLAATVDLADGYQEAITNALGVRLMSMFGTAVQGQVATLISELALQGEKQIVELNAKALGMPLDEPAPPQAEGQGGAK